MATQTSPSFPPSAPLASQCREHACRRGDRQQQQSSTFTRSNCFAKLSLLVLFCAAVLSPCPVALASGRPPPPPPPVTSTISTTAITRTTTQELPCNTVPAPVVSSGSQIFIAFLPASVQAMLYQNPDAWNAIGDAIFQAMHLSGVLPSSFFLGMDTNGASSGYIKAKMVVYRNEVECLERNLKSGLVVIVWQGFIYPLYYRPPATTAMATKSITTSSSTTTSSLSTVSRRTNNVLTTVKRTSTTKTTSTTTTTTSTSTTTTTTTTTPSITTTTTHSPEPATEDADESTVVDTTNDNMDPAPTTSMPDPFMSTEDPLPPVTLPKPPFNDHSEFQGWSGGRCDKAIGSSPSYTRMYFSGECPPSAWSTSKQRQALQNALMQTLGLGAANSYRDPIFDTTYTASAACGLSATGPCAQAIVGLGVEKSAVPCVLGLFANSSRLPVDVNGTFYGLTYRPNSQGIEMKFDMDYDTMLPDETARLSWIDLIYTTLQNHKVSMHDVLSVGIRPGSIDVTVLMNSTSNIQLLASVVGTGSFVVTFHNVTRAAALVVREDPAAQATSNSSVQLSGAIIGGICVAAFFVILVILVLVKVTRKTSTTTHSQAELLSSETMERDAPQLTWDNGDMQTDSVPPLHFAVLMDHPEELKHAIATIKRLGRSVNEKDGIGQTPLALASKLWMDGAVAMLLESGAEPNIASLQGLTALHLACQQHSPLPDAQHACIAVVTRLLKAGAAVDAVDSQGSTALFYAIRNTGCHLELLQLLTDYNADINHQDNQRMTIFMIAAHMGFDDVVKFLLGKRELRVNERDMSGRTALHWAVACGSRSCVEAMVAAKRFAVCVQSEDGDTPLHLACREGHADLARMLLNGCESDYLPALITAVNKYSNTALDVALASGHKDCARLLKQVELSLDSHSSPSHSGGTASSPNDTSESSPMGSDAAASLRTPPQLPLRSPPRLPSASSVLALAPAAADDAFLLPTGYEAGMEDMLAQTQPLGSAACNLDAALAPFPASTTMCATTSTAASSGDLHYAPVTSTLPHGQSWPPRQAPLRPPPAPPSLAIFSPTSNALTLGSPTATLDLGPSFSSSQQPPRPSEALMSPPGSNPSSLDSVLDVPICPDSFHVGVLPLDTSCDEQVQTPERVVADLMASTADLNPGKTYPADFCSSSALLPMRQKRRVDSELAPSIACTSFPASFTTAGSSTTPISTSASLPCFPEDFHASSALAAGHGSDGNCSSSGSSGAQSFVPAVVFGESSARHDGSSLPWRMVPDFPLSTSSSTLLVPASTGALLCSPSSATSSNAGAVQPETDGFASAQREKRPLIMDDEGSLGLSQRRGSLAHLTEEERETRKRQIHCEYMRVKRQAERDQISDMEKTVSEMQEDNASLQAELQSARIEAEQLRKRVALHRDRGQGRGGASVAIYTRPGQFGAVGHTGSAAMPGLMFADGALPYGSSATTAPAGPTRASMFVGSGSSRGPGCPMMPAKLAMDSVQGQPRVIRLGSNENGVTESIESYL